MNDPSYYVTSTAAAALSEPKLPAYPPADRVSFGEIGFMGLTSGNYVITHISKRWHFRDTELGILMGAVGAIWFILGIVGTLWVEGLIP